MGKSCFVRESPHQLAQFSGHIDGGAEAHQPSFNQTHHGSPYTHQEKEH